MKIVTRYSYDFSSYLQTRPLLSCNALFNFFLTVRGTGKTWALKRRSLERYFGHSSRPRSLWIRYFRDDVKTMAQDFLPGAILREICARYKLTPEKFKATKKAFSTTAPRSHAFVR